MVSDDRAIVLSGENAAEPVAPERRRAPLLFLLPIVGLFLVLIAFVATPQDEAPTTVDPSDLSAPSEPTGGAPGSTEATPSTTARQASTGWQTLVPVGDAWTISSVEHGPTGWLAVSMGLSTIAHTSTDGVNWSASTVTGMQGLNVVAAVGDDRMALAASPWSEDMSSGGVAVSQDGGVTWVVERFDEPALVRNVAVVDEGVLVVGETGTGDFQYTGAGTAAAWLLGEGGLRRLEVESSGLSQMAAIVEAPDGEVVLFGGDGEGPAAWRASPSGTWFPVPLPTPERSGAGAFRSVVAVSDGYMALISDPTRESGRRLWRSADLATWEPLAESTSTLIGISADGAGGAVGVAEGGSSIWTMDAAGNETVLDQFTGPERRIPVGLVLDVEVASGVAVAAVEADGAPGLMIRTPAEPSSVVARALEPYWERVASVDIPGATRFGWPFQSLRSGDSSFLSAPGRVIELSGLDGDGLLMTPSLSSPSYAGSGPLGVWVSGDPGQSSTLYVYGKDGVWSSQRVPVQQIEALGIVGDTPVAFGWALNAYQRLERNPDGEWAESTEQPDVGVYGAVATDGGFVAQAEAGGTVGSADGIVWEPLDGQLNSAWSGGAPFLTYVDDPTRIVVVDRWPVVDPLVLPDGLGYPFSVHRAGDDFWVQGADRLLVGVSGAWTEYPLALEHGIDGAVIPVVASRPTLAVVGFGEVSLLRVRD